MLIQLIGAVASRQALTRPGPDDEGTINVASRKLSKAHTTGGLKLKKSIVKQTKPGNWREGIVAECMSPARGPMERYN